ncbi:exodeoxyribonuclease III [Rhodococcus sp. 06-462-5]|nr:MULTISPECIES: exodeoxyribonuclease III [unclassified Rhodococcus (in: high G+C Gram-positive bacteria)]OZC78908.1 exodeoxyribonuclease III [Rhodococcus sp. 06-462-5]OZE63758.1 exodeoxyribonuclease III [Rhodococcus sp. 02-925g]
MPITVSTVNVNGIRAAVRKGMLPWLEATDADVICLQETRANDGELTKALAPALDVGWHLASAEPSAKGRNGVALLSKAAPDAIRTGIGAVEFADAGRYIEGDFGDVTVASLYLPSGEVGTERQDEKERFMAAFAKYLAKTAKAAKSDNRDVVVCGDWNIAHTEADLKAWKTNRKNSGFLPEEREWVTRLLAEKAPWTDVVRALHPGVEGPYSWWSYRGKAFDNDAGWRIDYQLATGDLAERAKEAITERAEAYDQRWSDHAPVTVRYR